MIGLKEESRKHCGMAYRYEMTNQAIDWEDGMKYTTYGVLVKNVSDEIVKAYPDISIQEQFVRELIDKCNQHELDPMHLEDVLLDSIG